MSSSKLAEVADKNTWDEVKTKRLQFRDVFWVVI
jgi:hypothetical protein